MIDRDISEYIKLISGQFSVVSIMGPRQSGKTTLAKMLFPDYDYVNFEWQSTLEDASRDLDSFLHKHPAPLIIDEVQCFPKILHNIQVLVDERPDLKAAYVITGSNQPSLRGVVSQSLAGRVANAYLLPLSFSELRREGIALDRAESIYRGFMPKGISGGQLPTLLYENYLTTYVERDVNQLINLKDQSRFLTLLRLLAARVGQPLNYISLANELGVSANTIRDWVSVMEASFVVFHVFPYFRNFGKRFVKTPKLYFTDVGLAAYLLELNSPKEIERNALFGQLFENMVMANIRKNRFNAGNMRMGTAGMYFLRDKTGNEVDLALEMGANKLDLIEIKSGMSYNADYAKSIEKYAKLIGDDFHSGKVIYAGTRAGYHGIDFVNFAET